MIPALGDSTREAAGRSAAMVAEVVSASRALTDSDGQPHSRAGRARDLGLSRALTSACRYHDTASRDNDLLRRSRARQHGRTPDDRLLE